MRYIGSKKRLAKAIKQAIAERGAAEGVFADLFAGTGAVAREFKKANYTVIAADLLLFPYILQRAYIQINLYPDFHRLLSHLDFSPCAEHALFVPPEDEQHWAKLKYVIQRLNELPGVEDFIFRNYTKAGTEGGDFVRQYFSDENGKRIDAVFRQIWEWHQSHLLSEDEYYLLMTAALEAVPLVANILGTFGAFKKGDLESRAVKPYLLTAPRLIASPHPNRAIQGDANVLVRETRCDLLYLDPPYNNRQYAEYYHLLETLAEGLEPEIGGLTGKPLGPRRLSRYCTKPGAREQFADLVSHAQAQHIFLSYSDDGLLSAEEIMQVLSLRGDPREPYKLAEHQRYRSDRNREAEGDRKRKYPDQKKVSEWLFHVEVTK